MKVIASVNGLAAVAKGYEELRAGAKPLDACVAGVAVIEDDPADATVGYGGLPNEDGIVELDAAVMDGLTHRGGAVAALRGIRHPAQVARLVMQQTKRVLLVGAGALRFAQANGFKEENLLTESSREAWLYWKRTRSAVDDWVVPQSGDTTPIADFKRATGTVHVAAIDASGNLACCTSTSGHAFKMEGRVGDSPILGAGLYVDNDFGTCGSVGWGEANLENLSSFAVVEQLRQGKSPREAGAELLNRIVKNAPAFSKNAEGKPQFNVTLIILAKSGEHTGVCLWGPREIAVADEKGARLEPCFALLGPGKVE